MRVLLLSLVCVTHRPARCTTTRRIVRRRASCDRCSTRRRSGGNEPVVCGKPDSIRTVHCSRKSDTARRSGIAGNSENVSPPNRTGTLDHQAPSVNTSRVCQREPSVGNSENLAPLVRNLPSSEPRQGKGESSTQFLGHDLGVRSRRMPGRPDRQSKTEVRGDSLIRPGECRDWARRCVSGKLPKERY